MCARARCILRLRASLCVRCEHARAQTRGCTLCVCVWRVRVAAFHRHAYRRVSVHRLCVCALCVCVHGQVCACVHCVHMHPVRVALCVQGVCFGVRVCTHPGCRINRSQRRLHCTMTISFWGNACCSKGSLSIKGLLCAARSPPSAHKC